MKKFTNELIVRSFGNKWELVEPFSFYYKKQNKTIETIVIPKGFITDFASTPRILYPIIPPIGIYNKACIIHDYIYQERIFPRKTCDLCFLQAMEVLEVPKWKRYLMFIIVRLFGKKYYAN